MPQPSYYSPYRQRTSAPMRKYGREGVNSSMTMYRRPKKLTKSTLSKVVRSLQPTKHFNNAPTQIGLIQDTYYSLNITAGIVQGNGDANRDGDEIYLDTLKLTGLVNTAFTAGAYSYRIIVGYSGEEYNFTTNFSSSGISTTEIFLPNTFGSGGTQWNQNGIINPKAFTVLHDKKITCNSQIAGVADLANFSYSVPLNSKFVYQQSGSQLGKTRNLFVILLGAVVGGVPFVNGVGTCLLSYDLSFKS